MALFSLLESLVGGEQEFQPFLKAYFAKFGGSTVNSEKMREFFLSFFAERAKDSAAVKAAMEGPVAALDWEKLFRSPGMPEVLPPCDAAPIEEAKALAQRWVVASEKNILEDFSAKDIESWSTTKLIIFLDALLADNEDGGGNISQAASARMAESYGFLTANCELRLRFLRLALGAKWEGAVASAVDLATSQGRMKFTRPMYRSLKAYDATLARETFAKYRSSYHPICCKMVAKDLDV